MLVSGLVLSVWTATAQVPVKTTPENNPASKKENAIQTKAANHNSTRSNRTTNQKVNSDTPPSDSGTKVQDHNSSRSNKTSSKVDQGDNSGGNTGEKVDKSEQARAKKK